jgi:hypothetical protein
MQVTTKAIIPAGLAITLLLVEIVAQPAEAIPAFARKYETSCVTCHIGFPKLNSFGEAFRLGGYQYPKDDAEMTKDEPVSLGSDAYKRVFPDAVWPNDIPGKPPLSLRVSSGFEYDDTSAIQTEFVAPSLNLMAGGTLGSSLGFYAGAHVFERGEIGSIDRVFLQINNIFGSRPPDKLVNLKGGQFIMNLVPFANHRGLSITPYAYNNFSALNQELAADHGHAGDAEAFSLEEFQLGVEAAGIVRSRWRWGAGLVNGNGAFGDNNDAKDGYGRVAVKIGGMGFDGRGVSAASAKNWRDNSVTLGILGYTGSYPNSGTVGPKDLGRYRLGVDVSLLIRDLNLFGGYLRGSDETMDGATVHDAGYNVWFAQADYVIFPWLIGIGRFEQANPDDASSLERIVAGATTLVRANVKLVIESTFDPNDRGFKNMALKVDFAM